jgi:hypothetical protein
MSTPRSLLYFLLIVTVLLSVAFPFIRDRYVDNVFWSDAEGYYLYLPAVVIHGGFDKVPVRTPYQFEHYPGTDKHFTKYTYGVSVMQAPFFLVAHAYERWSGGPATGYERAYIHLIRVAGIFYLLLGLWFSGMVLRRMGFSGAVSVTALAAILLGTNLLHYTAHEPSMSHIYSFALFAWLLYALPGFYRTPGIGRTVLIALLLGLLTLIRPTNIVATILAVFYGATDWESLKARVQFFRQHLGMMLLIPLLAFLLWVPQFYYWKYTSGHWLVYSYNDEGFTNWARPEVFKVLFDVKSGWILFSPIVVLPIVGLFIGAWRNVYESRVLLAVLLLSLYLFASWWCWWFGGSFGHRSFVELYPLLAIPFAYLTQLVFGLKRKAWRIPYFFLLALLIYYSLSMLERYRGPHYDWYTWRRAMEACMPFLF